MNNQISLNNDLLMVIVNFGKGSKIMKIAKDSGIKGGTIVLGRGTANSHILKMLKITDIRKEIVLMATPEELTPKIVSDLHDKFDFDKPNHGIAFTMSLANLCGHPNSKYINNKESKGNEQSMHTAIFVIVNKGSADDVVDAAVAVGARGATIINGRGTGIHEQKILFAFPVEPEKEIVLIIAQSSLADVIVEKIRNDFHIDTPGMGILFTMNLKETYGLH